MASIVSTWSFSEPGMQAAMQAMRTTNCATEAVTQGIKTVELDPSVTSAGYGGLPNAAGNLQLDAAIMTSSGKLGSVMALEGFPSAINPARLVMKRSVHPVLVGDGAHAFAVECGLDSSDDLLTAHAKRRYKQFLHGEHGPQLHQNGGMSHTDTVGMIARDSTGAITAGCATSGMQFKAVGRVGDSPIVGAGLYADAPGAAVASGDGDKMLRFSLSFLVVERMRAGDTVEQACRHAVYRVHDSDPTCQAAVAAMSSSGELGAACTHEGFSIVAWKDGMLRPEVLTIPGSGGDIWKHSCV